MRIFIISLISLAAIGFSSQAFAEAQCKSNGSCCEELNRMWQEHFSQDFLMYSSDKYKLSDTFKCPGQQSKLAEGLMVLLKISKSNSTSIDYYDQSSSITKSAGYRLLILDLKDSFASTNHNILGIIFSAFNSDLLSPSEYASQIVHETEHVERTTKHTECNHGQNKGRVNCDTTLGPDLSDNYGAYTSQFIYLSDVRKSSANDLLKKTSKAMMKTLLENQFNTVPSKGPDGVTPLRDYYDL